MNEKSILENYVEEQETLSENLIEQSKKVPWWCLSVGIHVLLIGLLTMVFVKPNVNQEKYNRTIEAEIQEIIEEPYEPEVKKDIEKETKEIPQTNPEVVVKSEVVEITNVDVADKMEIDTDSDFEEMADADMDNQLLTNVSADTGNFTGIGIGGGGGGAWGRPGKGGRRNSTIKSEGGSEKTESAMDAALYWLKRHQTVDIIKSNEEDVDVGLWLQYHWYRECAGYDGQNKGGENSIPLKFPNVCSVKHYHVKSGVAPKDWQVEEETKGRCEKHTMAVSSLALLAFAGSGETHKRGRFRKTIKNAISLLSITLSEAREGESYDKAIKFREGKQPGVYAFGEHTAFQKIIEKKIENLFDKSQHEFTWSSGSGYGDAQIMYQHSIMALAINEIYGVSRDTYLKEMCSDSIQALLASKGNPGWRYNYNFNGHNKYAVGAGCGDISVSTWAIMAVKASKAVGILDDVSKKLGTTSDKVMNDMKEIVNVDASGDVNCLYALNPTDGQANPSSDRSPLYLSDVAFLYKGDEMVTKMKSRVEDFHKRLRLDDENPYGCNFWGIGGKEALPQSPESFQSDYYFMYYATLALFQYGGDSWDKYNKITSDWLVKNQNSGKKCSDGSFEQSRSHNIGRVYNTAMCALQLQVYYRYKSNKSKK